MTAAVIGAGTPTGSRGVFRTTDGALWAVVKASNTLSLYVSRDNGTTWTATSWSFAATYPVVYMTPDGLLLVGDLNTSSYRGLIAAFTVDLPTGVVTALGSQYTYATGSSSALIQPHSIVAHKKDNATWRVVVQSSYNGSGTYYVMVHALDLAMSGGAWANKAAANTYSWPNASGISTSLTGLVEMRHDGVESTTAGTRDIFVWAGSYVAKLAATGADTYTMGSTYSAGGSAANPGSSMAWDGTRVVLAGAATTGTTSWTVRFWDPDGAAAAVAQTAPAAAPGTVASGGIVVDKTSGKMVLWSQSSSAPLSYNVRATDGTWAGWVSSGGPNASTAYAEGNTRGGKPFGVAYAAASGGNTYFDAVSFNTAPNAPIVSVPSVINLAVVNRIGVPLNDPDPGDSQSQLDIQWWDLNGAGARVGGPYTHSDVNPNQYWDSPGNTFTAGVKEIQGKDYDSQGAASPWSASAFFTAAVAPPAPTITAPVNNSTVVNTATVTWSAPDQKAYRIRRVADNAGAADTTTVYWDSGVITDAVARSLTVTFDTNNRYEHVQIEIENAAGLWSTWADSRVQVSYTPPATPTRALTAAASPPTVTVAITNPNPAGGQPAVAYNDVYVDDDDGNGFVRKATGLATNSTWVYRLPRSGVDYSTRIKVTAVATNGTTASSS